VYYYEHHINDYEEAAGHLSAIEDGIYCRLIRKYYAKEGPLPADIGAIQRLAKARTRGEKKAVVTILNEFFNLREDGWHNSRCDEEIDAYFARRKKRKDAADLRWGNVPQIESENTRQKSQIQIEEFLNSDNSANPEHIGQNGDASALQTQCYPVPSPQSPVSSLNTNLDIGAGVLRAHTRTREDAFADSECSAEPESDQPTQRVTEFIRKLQREDPKSYLNVNPEAEAQAIRDNYSRKEPDAWARNPIACASGWMRKIRSGQFAPSPSLIRAKSPVTNAGPQRTVMRSLPDQNSKPAESPPLSPEEVRKILEEQFGPKAISEILT